MQILILFIFLILVFQLNKAVLLKDDKNVIFNLLDLQKEDLFESIILNTKVFGTRYILALAKAQIKKTENNNLPNEFKCICENFVNIGNIFVTKTDDGQLQIMHEEGFSIPADNCDKCALTRNEIKVCYSILFKFKLNYF